MSRFKLFIPLIIVVLLSPFLIIALDKDPSHLPSALIGKPFPDVDLPRLKGAAMVDENVAGKNMVSREDLIGEPFILNVWATWCPTCIHEHPYLMMLAEKGVRIVGLNYKDEDEKALGWLKRLGDPYLFNIVDKEGRLGLYLGVYGAPETFIVDKNGTILLRHAGDLNARVWQDQFAPIMDEL